MAKKVENWLKWWKIGQNGGKMDEMAKMATKLLKWPKMANVANKWPK